MAQAVRRTLYKAWKVDVTCCPNDRVDIKCGGPGYLGFDFTVDASVSKKKWEKFLRKALAANDLPCMGISFERRSVEVAKRQLWSERKINKAEEGHLGKAGGKDKARRYVRELRVSEETEINGLDISEHGERAYN